MKKIFNKNTILYIIFNSLSFLLMLYFILRLFFVIKKPLFIKDFSVSSRVDFVFFILIFDCVILLGNIFIYLVANKKNI
ncbi:unknown [Staphylococcus sp. CAG:324]|nr:unknown [Staphylococcus sp. CAG:324]